MPNQRLVKNSCRYTQDGSSPRFMVEPHPNYFILAEVRVRAVYSRQAALYGAPAKWGVEFRVITIESGGVHYVFPAWLRVWNKTAVVESMNEAEAIACGIKAVSENLFRLYTAKKLPRALAIRKFRIEDLTRE